MPASHRNDATDANRRRSPPPSSQSSTWEDRRRPPNRHLWDNEQRIADPPGGTSNAGSTEHETLWREGQAALVGLLATLKDARERAASNADLTTLLKTAQFALLFNYDLRQLDYDVARASDVWARGLYCRLLALTLYECSRDLMELLSKEFRGVVKRLQPAEGFEALNALHARLRAFQKADGDYLKAVRVQVIGHRDHDPDVQLRQIESLDTARVLRAADTLLVWLNDFWAFTGSLISAPPAPHAQTGP